MPEPTPDRPHDTDPMADDPSALPPRLARRAVRGRVPWGMLALEGFITVVAILLALAADDWRQRREERALADDAARAFIAEITANRERVAKVLPYHRALRAAVDSALGARDGRVIRNPRDVYPEFRGIRPAFLTRAAWESAVATGALRHLSPDALRTVSLAYETQANLAILNRTMYGVVLDPAVTAAPDFDVAARIMSVYLADVVPIERELTTMYDQLLAALRHPTAP